MTDKNYKLTNPITWLHLSDIHCRVEDSWNMDIVLDALLKDIGGLGKDPNYQLQADFIVVTGDIAFSGQKGEYKLAAQFFDRLLKAVHLGKDRLFLVPGNHDVNRKEISSLAEFIKPSLTNRDKVNKLLQAGEGKGTLFEGQRSYFQFTRDYLGGAQPVWRG